MADEVLTAREIGEAEARAGTLELIRQRAIATFGESEEVMAQVAQIGLAIEALSYATGPELAAKTVSWKIFG